MTDMVSVHTNDSLRALLLLAPIVGITIAASEAEAVPVSCTGWGGTTMTWNGPAYAIMTAELYREDVGGDVLVETSVDVTLWVLPGSQIIGANWVNVPLDGTYYAVIEAWMYGGLDHVPTAEELAAWPSNRTYHLTETTPSFTCVAPPPYCGDGMINGDEACDDGNTTADDGCSPTCSIEPPQPVCGDRIVDAGEACDDGNTAAGDGCSPTCTIEPPTGCTRTIGYWGRHFSTARNESQRIAWPISEGTQLCGQTWLTRINATPRGGDAFVILARQWIAAQLNGAAGASQTPTVAAAIARAEALLSDCSITSAERPEALDVASVLDAHNNGLIGPGHCE